MSHLRNPRAPRRIVPRITARPCRSCFTPLLADERILCAKCLARQQAEGAR